MPSASASKAPADALRESLAGGTNRPGGARPDSGNVVTNEAVGELTEACGGSGYTDSAFTRLRPAPLLLVMTSMTWWVSRQVSLPEGGKASDCLGSA